MILKDVRKYIKEYYEQIQTHTRIIQRQYNINEFKFYVKGVNNQVAIACEITDNFIYKIEMGRSSISPDLLRQRLKNVYRDIIFVPSMSIFEYSFIRSLLLCPDLDTTKKVIKTGERKVQISKLLKWMNQDKLIDNYYLWYFATNLRNDIVHYDAFGRETMECPEIDFPIKVVEGEMAEGILRSFVSITKSLENSFFNFITNLPTVTCPPKSAS